jgi:hypothetical protein
MSSPTSLETLFSASIFDKDPPDCNRSGTEEMALVLPHRRLLSCGQSQERLVNECGWLESLAGTFVGELIGSKFAQLIVNQWQKSLAG